MSAAQRCLDCAAALYIDPASGDLIDVWGERICSASYRPHVADVPHVQVRAIASAAPEKGTHDRQRWTGHSTGPGLTGDDCPASRTLRAAYGGPPKNGRLLDTGHPATPVADGPCGQAEKNTASRTSGPTTHLTKGIHR